MSSSVSFGSLRSIFPILLLFAALGALPCEAKAASFIVTSSADNGPGSLRDAIALANGAPSDDVITFSSTPMVITLTSEIQITGNGSLSIDGGASPHNVTIDGGSGGNRIFNVQGNVFLRGMTLQNGGDTADNASSLSGAAILSTGTLTLDSIIVQNNWAPNGSTIENTGNGLTVNNAIVQNNSARAFVSVNSTTRISNSTISGNLGANCSPYTGRGGTLYMVNTTTTGNLGPFCLDNQNGDQGFIVRNSTISDSILLDGSVLTNTLVTLDIGNTILAGSTDGSINILSDIYLQGQRINVISRGGNVVGVNNTGLIFLEPGTPNAQGDLVGQPGSAVNAGLLPLADNGGSVPTAALAAASVARDYGINANAVDPFNSQPLANDARGAGFQRISNTAVDVGAYEFQVLVVDNTTDNAALSACVEAVANDCSLRGAIAKANTTAPGEDIIVFSNVFNSPQTIPLSATLPAITSTMTINGGNHKIVISGSAQTRIFDVNAGGGLTIQNLTLANARSSTSGGAIFNNGTLTVISSTLTNDSVVAGANGGGIFNAGTATIVNSTISGNSAIASGAGIFNIGTLSLTSCTVANNVTAAAAGGIFNSAGAVSAKNTIIAGNFDSNNTPDLSGVLTSQGYNLIGNANGATIAGDTTGNILNQNAQLAPLADNGGNTSTHRLLLGSPAIDKGKSFGSTADQRGLGRPFDVASIPNAAGGDAADIGAFEVRSQLLVVSAPASATAGTPFSFTVTVYGTDGNVATGYSGTIHFTSSDGNSILPADYTFVPGDNGAHQFSATLETPGNQTITAADTVAGPIRGTSSNISVSPAGAVRFSVAATTPVWGRLPFTLTVTAFDAFDNVATGYRGTVHFTSTDANAVLPADYVFTAADNGTHQFSPALYTIGNQTITATDTVNASITGTSNTIAVQANNNNGIVVTRLDDREQNCSVGDCSLREAVKAANVLPGDDTISFDPNVFATPQTIELTSISSFNLVRNNGTLTINGARKVNITGPNYSDRAFQVLPGANLTINDLGIDGVGGGGISVGGGGILTLNNSTISNCVSGHDGLGIQNNGVLVMNNSTISGNTSPVANNHSGNGGGIFNAGTATITNSTIAENQLYDCACVPGLGQGGGIYNSSIGTVTIANTIIAHNHSGYGTDDLYGTFVSQGYNLISQAFPGTTTITGDTTGNILNQFAQLGPLADNGGGLKTQALVPGSPAIDHGKSFGATTDQRGLTRPYDEPTIPNAAGGDGSDMGAFEVQANTILVNTATDGDDGACTAVGTGNGCTLREAINAADSTGVVSTIGFDPTTFPSTAAGAASTSSVTLQLASGLPALSANTLISGPGARSLTVRGEGTADPYTVFTIASGATVTISGLTITNGVANSNVNGGGITNAGTLTLQNVAVSGNPASTVANASGAIFNSGTMTIQSSTISGNSAGSVGIGGGINSNSTLTLQNSTVSGNTARSAGGINNTGTMTLQNSTVTANTATVRGGGIGGFGPLTLRSSIVAGNSALLLIQDVDGTAQSDGYNLIGDSGGATINPNPGAGPDILDVGAQLGALANNGGQTDTHAPASASPAVDQGKAFGSTTDQRGLTRPIDNLSIANAAGGDGSDIGAFEVQLASAATVTISGRILTADVTADGRGLRNARITLTDSQGVSRSVLTDSHGYFLFSDLTVGESVVINVSSRRYRFTPRLLTIYDNIS